MLVKITPAELITTDVMRMTLETGTSVDAIASAFSLTDGPSFEERVAVPEDEGGVSEDEREL